MRRFAYLPAWSVDTGASVTCIDKSLAFFRGVDPDAGETSLGGNERGPHQAGLTAVSGVTRCTRAYRQK